MQYAPLTGVEPPPTNPSIGILWVFAVPKPNVARQATTTPALERKPSSTTYLMAPAPKPTVAILPVSATYVARVLDVGFVASFKVKVPAVVLPSIFLIVIVVPLIENSVNRASIM